MNPSKFTIEQLKSLWKNILNKKDQYNELFNTIKYDIDEINQKEIEKNAKQEMLDFAEEYNGCENFKETVDNAGLDNYYNGHTDGNIPFDIFTEYIEDNNCWCGICSEKTQEDTQEEIIEDLCNLIENTSYTCNHLKKIYGTNDAKFLILFIKELKYDNSIKFKILKRLVTQKDCFCEKCGKKDEDTSEILETMFLEDDSKTCNWLKDIVKNVGTEKFYYNNKELIKKVPIDRFLKCIYSEKCWCHS